MSLVLEDAECALEETDGAADGVANSAAECGANGATLSRVLTSCSDARLLPLAGRLSTLDDCDDTVRSSSSMLTSLCDTVAT